MATDVDKLLTNLYPIHNGPYAHAHIITTNLMEYIWFM